MARPERATEVLNRFAEALSNVSTVENEVKMEGKQMFMLLAPNNK